MWASVCIFVAGLANMSGRLVFLMLFFNQNVFREKKNTCALHMYLN